MTLAFLAVIQLLPPRQRAVLLLRDVLAFTAAETAAVLDSSPAAVNSALQRARTTLAQFRPDQQTRTQPADEAEKTLLDRYITAHERLDPQAIIAVLRDLLVHGRCVGPIEVQELGPEEADPFRIDRGGARHQDRDRPPRPHHARALPLGRTGAPPSRLVMLEPACPRKLELVRREARFVVPLFRDRRRIDGVEAQNTPLDTRDFGARPTFWGDRASDATRSRALRRSSRPRCRQPGRARCP